MNSKRTVFWTIAGALALVGLLVAATGARAERPGADNLAPAVPAATVSSTITYQGRLLDSDGEVVDGTSVMTFGVYTQATGGTPGWTDSFPVMVNEGLFSVGLEVPSELFDGQALWLGVQVAGDAQELTPRQAILPAPYALYALAAPWSGLTDVPLGLDDGDDDTVYSAGSGMMLAGTTFEVSPTYRLPQACGDGDIAEWNASAGGWDCGGDDVGGGEAAWLVGGNTGTDPGTDVLGTTDEISLTLVVDDSPALRLEPGAVPNLIGGDVANGTTSGVLGATIGGGGSTSAPNRVTDEFGVIGGGEGNTAGDDSGSVADATHATVGGGEDNAASGWHATVGGGFSNTVSGGYATIGGGEGNTASNDHATVGGGDENTASGTYATVSGGTDNAASGYGAAVGGGNGNIASSDYATVGGGDENTASGSKATVGGGGYNTASNYDATIGGGENNTASGMGATVGGGWYNTASGNYATIGGGLGNVVTGTQATIGAGYYNTASDDYATVGGGVLNTASGSKATVAGGGGNTASGDYAAIAGGYGNIVTGTRSFVGSGYQNVVTATDGTIAGGYENAVTNTYATIGGGRWNRGWGVLATVGGGSSNVASGVAATIPGGYINTASGDYSFAAGRRAKANHDGAFVWGDSTNADINSPVANSFIVRANGGIWFGEATSDYTPTIGSGVFINTSTGGYLSTAGNWVSVSDRNLKDSFASVDNQEVLARVAELPITTWSYKAEDAGVRHMGPVAQDFYAAFSLGSDDKHIAALDAAGVALAAIQGLYAENQALEEEVATLKDDNAALRRELDDLEARVAVLEQTGTSHLSPTLNAWWPLAGLVGLAGVVVVWRRRREDGR